MIVFLTISKRRFYVLSVPSAPTGWHNSGDTANSGYLHSRADIIAGPCSWSEALSAASSYAKEKGAIISYENYCKQRDASDAQLRALEKERKKGAGK